MGNEVHLSLKLLCLLFNSTLRHQNGRAGIRYDAEVIGESKEFANKDETCQNKGNSTSLNN